MVSTTTLDARLQRWLAAPLSMSIANRAGGESVWSTVKTSVTAPPPVGSSVVVDPVMLVSVSVSPSVAALVVLSSVDVPGSLVDVGGISVVEVGSVAPVVGMVVLSVADDDIVVLLAV